MKNESKKDKVYFFVVLPILIIAMIVGYFFVDKLSNRNSKICNYLGKIWIPTPQKSTDLAEGCYTYEQLAKLGKL